MKRYYIVFPQTYKVYSKKFYSIAAQLQQQPLKTTLDSGMNSKVLLDFKKAEVNERYIRERSLQIRQVSTACLLFVCMALLGVGAIDVYNGMLKNFLRLWVPKICSVVIQVIALIAFCKYPTILYAYYGPLLVILQMSILLWSRDQSSKDTTQPIPPHAMVQSIASLILALLFGFMCNARWLFTGISMVITVITTLTYYKLYHNFGDVMTTLIVALILCLLIYSCYVMELRDKNMYLQMHTVERMNEELKNIFINLPEGIVLINEENSQVSLGNYEFLRLFSLNRNTSNAEIAIKLAENVLVPHGTPKNDYNTHENTNFSRHSRVSQAGELMQYNGLINQEYQRSFNSEEPARISLLDATINQRAEGMSFKIVPQLNLQIEDIQNHCHCIQQQEENKSENARESEARNSNQNQRGSGSPLSANEIEIDLEAAGKRPPQHPNNIRCPNFNDHQDEIITFKQQPILYLNQKHRMIIAKSITHYAQNEQLKLQNHFLEMLTATISHDMRTPLNAILGMGKNLEKHVTSQKGLKYHCIMMNSAQLLHFLVNDLLDLCRLRNGKFTKNDLVCDLRQDLRDLVDIFSLQAQEKGIELILDVHPNVPQELTIDIQRVKQILINLIANSLKFTFQGSIKVAVMCNTEDYSSPKLQICVSDTGIGIEKNDRHKIFKMFGKLDSTAQINTSGVGLGLSICKKIVEALEGDILLADDLLEENKEQSPRDIFEQINADDHHIRQQKGTTFVITLALPDPSDFPELMRSRQTTGFYESQHENIVTHLEDLHPAFQDHDTEHLQQEVSQRYLLCDAYLDEGLPTLRVTRKRWSSQHHQNFIGCCDDRPDVLIVDDNVFNILTLQTILEGGRNKMASDKAMNGLEAVIKVKDRLLRDQREPCICEKKRGMYKIIFMDCNMPVMDGFQATAEIRKLIDQAIKESEKDSPARLRWEQPLIVALTAYATDAFERKSQQAGMNQFLTKPISEEKISLLVSEIKGKR